MTTTPAPEGVTVPTRVQALPLDAIAPHPANRKHFDEAQLRELAESLREKGQLTPALVRPLPGKANRYQLLAGERRWRAATLAGIPTLICLVRELDDEAALEVLAIENNQRQDVHPLEEAELYKALLAFKGHDVASVARKLGRSPTYVRERLRLLRLIPKARELMVAGKIPLRHAVLLATLSERDQKRAIEGDDSHFGDGPHGLFRTEELLWGDGPRTETVVSEREFRDWIKDTVRLDPKGELVADLFPETRAAVDQAEAARRPVLQLSSEWHLDAALKDPKQRILSAREWKRADGTRGHKKCPHAELGVVVVGALQGQAFLVCATRSCDLHWAEERKLAAQRQPSATRAPSAQQQQWEARARKEREERERWKKAVPTLLERLAERVKATPVTPTGVVATTVLKTRQGLLATRAKRHFPAPKNAEDVLRALAFAETASRIDDEWRAASWAVQALKPWGLDAKKIRDAVAPPATPPGKGKAKTPAKQAGKTPAKAGKARP
jgi:ParB/RepB/Spo0J family partition protein